MAKKGIWPGCHFANPMARTLAEYRVLVQSGFEVLYLHSLGLQFMIREYETAKQAGFGEFFCSLGDPDWHEVLQQFADSNDVTVYYMDEPYSNEKKYLKEGYSKAFDAIQDRKTRVSELTSAEFDIGDTGWLLRGHQPIPGIGYAWTSYRHRNLLKHNQVPTLVDMKKKFGSQHKLVWAYGKDAVDVGDQYRQIWDFSVNNNIEHVILWQNFSQLRRNVSAARAYEFQDYFLRNEDYPVSFVKRWWKVITGALYYLWKSLTG
jgi:hypothetical protein